jgi:hypothetical protein
VIAIVGRASDRRTTAVARRIARAGGLGELVATVAMDRAGDRALLDLAAAGVGHAAALRSPAAALEPADLDLALRYLPDLRVVVLAADAATLGATAAASAAWAGARLVAVADGDPPAALPDDAIVLAAPPSDPDEAFAGIVAALATRLDAGEAPAAAWAAVARDLGVEGAARDAPREAAR